MDRYDLDEVVAPPPPAAGSPLKDWRLKHQAGLLQKNDFIEFFTKESRKYFEYQNEFETGSSLVQELQNSRERRNSQDTQEKRPQKGSLKCMFKEEGAKEGIIDVLLEFILGDNPKIVLEKLRLEGNTATVCGKVFKIGEPTYSCRECGMDPTCVLCVNCFKQSAHRYHKYKMSTSGGGGCCDCGDEEAWKKDHYCEEHLRGKENPHNSAIITDAIKERCEMAFIAILSFCVNFLEIETHASLECLDLDNDGSDDEYFCTVLYNDEAHTFDQVIQTLTNIAKIRQKDAKEIVAAIDREGRAVVKYDKFYACSQLKEKIEKQSVTMNAVIPNSTRVNQSLRTSVLHIRAVSCQQFALQLLTWFQEFLIRHCTFRQIFAKVIQDKRAPYNIRHILEYDVKLWKTARTCWHRLLISGMLMEYDNKMALAQEFSRNYANVVQEFIRDDHDHSFSIVSLSVQLFTVPSIAHYLIANEGIFYKLLLTFYHESIEEYIQNKTLHFSKNMANMGFLKRAAYILYDLRYILSFKPDNWTVDLREGFLEGCKALLRVLNVMQGMESVTRQIGQHMDYEPEWECAFNLHIKLASTISLVIDWASSDSEVLLKLYKMVMRSLMNNTFIVGQNKTEERTVAGHVSACLMYDVAVRPVSIHLPLSRFFAGIYLHLGAYGLNYDNIMPVSESATGKATPRDIMEPVLCTQTMIAQVHSGMWRRNGYSLLHQLYFYRNVRCRTEMLDRDVVCMQIGASLMESNQYLIQLLSKYNLIGWIQHDYESSMSASPSEDDFIRQLSMIDEFLDLLIVVIGERWVPGIANVTNEDRTKKEIMQLLCIKSYSHSELNRALHDSNNDTVLEDVIDSVAVFKKPQKSDAKGVYELKEELYDDYNMYFYHYTKEDKSKSEETQRTRRKAKGELVCCPPPKLPKLTDAFVSIANLLQCDVFMTIVSTVLERGLDLRCKTFTENHLQKVLHMIGYGIQEELSENYPFLTFYERSKKYEILSKLEELSRSGRVETHRDFILWTVKRLKEFQAKELPASSKEDGDVAMQVNDDEEAPMTAAEQEKLEKEERARLAAARRAKIMAQMLSAQANFIQSNAEMFASTSTGSSSSSAAAAGCSSGGAGTSGGTPTASSSTKFRSGGMRGTEMEWDSYSVDDAEPFHGYPDDDDDDDNEGAAAYKTTACLGVDRRLQQPSEQSFKCILCFEDCAVSKYGPALVYSAFIQKSKVLYESSAKRTDSNSYVHTSSCGHVMHSHCWQEYYNNEESKEQRRPHRSRLPFISGQNTEFHCPYCRCLSNAVLPLTAPLSKFCMPNVIHKGENGFTISNWMEVMKTFGSMLTRLRLTEDSDMVFYGFPTWESVLKSANVMADLAKFEKAAQPVQKTDLHETWTNVVVQYIKTVRQFAPTEFEINENEGIHWMFQSCIYTVEALEVYMRAIDKPFKMEMSIRHESCLSGLVRSCCLYAANLSQNDIMNLILPVAELLDTAFRHVGESVLEWNCFGMMASAIFMVSNMMYATDMNLSVVPNGNLTDFYALQFFFCANMVKAIITFELTTTAADPADSSMEIDYCDETTLEYVEQMPENIRANIINFYRKYNLAHRRAQHNDDKRTPRSMTEESGGDSTPSDVESIAAETPPIVPITTTCERQQIGAIYEHIKSEMSDYLRCSCLFFHFVTDVEFPDEFATNGSDTYENMCKYLGLDDDLGAYFDKTGAFISILEHVASHDEIVNYDFNGERKPNGQEFIHVPCRRPLPKLVELPDDYSDLINSVSDFICPNNEREEMKSPTMCLICGTILCGQSYCCQPEMGSHNVGACTYHANICGADIGIFLRIRDCQVVYLGRSKGCFVQPPYLDEYGETDQGLRRGNPLRLCPTAYGKINLHWLGHGLHEEIARLNDNSTVAVTQWHNI